MATKFHMIGDLILVQREKKTKDGNIDLPENMQEYSMTGKVLATGPGQLSPKEASDRMPMQVKVGDTVLCPPSMNMIHADPLHPNPKEALFFCREGQLVAILTEAE